MRTHEAAMAAGRRAREERSRKWIWIVTAIVVATLLPAAPVLASEITCGSVVTTDLKLQADLIDCHGSGLLVGAGGITIDLNGHTIDGTYSLVSDGGFGVGIGRSGLGRRDGVTIKNGTIREFYIGLALGGLGGERLRVDRISAIANRNGFDLGGRHQEITNNDVGWSTHTGMFIDSFHDSVLRGNVVHDNGGSGIGLEDNSNMLIEKNTFFNNQRGIFFEDEDNSFVTVENNQFFGNSIEGIRVKGVEQTIRKNTVTGNGVDGILIRLDHPSDELLRIVVERNDAHGNGDDGIEVQGSSVTLTKNTTNGNGDLGIEAVPGVTDGGKNKASGNGNPIQCIGVVCS